MAGFVNRLLSLFSSGEQEETAEPRCASRAAGKDPPGRASDRPAKTAENGFLDFLAQKPVSETPPELTTGSIRLLRVGGDDDAPVPQRLRNIASREVKQGLGPADFSHPDRDGSYVFCFSDPDLDRARLKTAAITERIRERVADELPDIAPRFAIQPNVTRIDRRLIVGSDMPPLEALISAIDRIRNEQRDQWQASRVNAIRVSQLLFQPAWSRCKDAPTFNRCIMDLAGLPFGSASEPSPQLLGRFDAYVLTKAIERLHSSARNSLRKPELLVPVHYLALEARGPRQEFLALYERIPYEYSHLLCFEVQLPAASEVPLRLRQTLDSLAPLLHRLVLQIPDFDLRLIEGMSTALFGASCSLAESDGVAAELQPRLEKFTRAAARRQLRSVATEANCMGSANAARQAGVDYLIGNAVNPTQDEPAIGTLPGARLRQPGVFSHTFP